MLSKKRAQIATSFDTTSKLAHHFKWSILKFRIETAISIRCNFKKSLKSKLVWYFFCENWIFQFEKNSRKFAIFGIYRVNSIEVISNGLFRFQNSVITFKFAFALLFRTTHQRTFNTFHLRCALNPFSNFDLIRMKSP